MLMLLPPSEGKSAPTVGTPVSLEALSFPQLTRARSTVLDRLIALSGRPQTAMRILGLGPTQRGEVARNLQLRQAPTAPAIDVYSGVLYEALDAAHMSTPHRARLQESVVIASGLWGLVRAFDPIPAYRLSGETSLPVIGSLANLWRDPITGVLAEHTGPILDLRSTAYRYGSLPAREDVATIRVLLERAGRRTIVSHHNKATKGRIARALVTSRRRPRTIADVIGTLQSAGLTCEVTRTPRGGTTLDVITHEL